MRKEGQRRDARSWNARVWVVCAALLDPYVIHIEKRFPMRAGWWFALMLVFVRVARCAHLAIQSA